MKKIFKSSVNVASLLPKRITKTQQKKCGEQGRCQCAATKENERNLTKNLSNKTRDQKIETLKEFFLKNLAENPTDGSPFDCDVLNHLNALENKYSIK